MNASIPVSTIRYYTTNKENTIAIYVFYDSATTTLKQSQELMSFWEKVIRDQANARGWNWLKLGEKYKTLK